MLTKILFLFGLVVLHLLLGVAKVTGQEPNKPILLGSPQTGTLSHDSPELAYAFTAREGLNIMIELLIADGDLIPRISLRQEDVTLQTWEGTQGELIYNAVYSFKAPGQYVIAVSSIDHTSGIYVLTVRESRDDVLTPLSFDVPVSASVARGESMRYIIQADAVSNTIISIDINNVTRSVSARLTAPDGKTIGVIGQDLDGGGFRIPSGVEQFVLEVINGDNGSVPVDFTVLLSRSTQ